MALDRDTLTSEDLEKILQGAFLPDGQIDTPIVAGEATVEKKVPTPRVAVIESVSYAIASQPDRIAEARRRSTLTPEPTKSTLIDLRYKRLANHKAGRRPDEITRIMGEFPNGEYNDAFNKVNEGKEDFEMLPVFDGDDPLDITGEDEGVLSRQLFDDEYYRYMCAANTILLVRLNANDSLDEVSNGALRTLLLDAKGEYDVVAEYEYGVYVFLAFNSNLEEIRIRCDRMRATSDGSTFTIGGTASIVGEEAISVMSRAHRALQAALRTEEGTWFISCGGIDE